MARYDKYDPISGGFRAPLNADLPATEKTGVGNPVGVTINSSGRAVVGGASGTAEPIVGVLCTTRDMKAGDIVDIMTHGEIVECATPAAAGVVLFVNEATGALETAVPGAGVNKYMVGSCVEAASATAVRLVVNGQYVQG